MNFTTKKINIVFMSDFHLGNEKCDLPFIKGKIKRISRMNNTFVYLVGDLIENAINGIGIAEQEFSVAYQIRQLRELIAPIKDKIIGCVLGNHEWRTTKAAQVNLLKELYEAILGIPVYDIVDYFPIYLTGRQYRIYVWHPTSGGTTTGYIMRLFQRASRVIAGDYDLMVFGHFHRKLIHKRSYMALDGTLRYKYDCISGHALTYHKGYAHRKLLTPHEKGFIIATFYRDEHRIEVEEF